MSARVGSTTDNSLGGWYSYRASKAAVNSLTKSFDIFVNGRSGNNAMAMAYHPGTVKTGLSKEFWGKVAKEKLFDPEFAVEKMCDNTGSVGLKGRGRCWDWKGTEVLP
jgi:NAD(P)-dependent dehydrogenase (short-subunit alcohol dehydrogenase family)